MYKGNIIKSIICVLSNFTETVNECYVYSIYQFYKSFFRIYTNYLSFPGIRRYFLKTEKRVDLSFDVTTPYDFCSLTPVSKKRAKGSIETFTETIGIGRLII